MTKKLLSTLIVLNTTAAAMAQLVGVDYNDGNWEYRSVDPVTGNTTFNNTLNLPNGLTSDSLVTDSASDNGYLLSDNSLLNFNLGTGANVSLSSLDTTIAGYGVGSSGLVGVAFNSNTGNWEYRTINAATGGTTLENTFTLVNGFTDASFVTDRINNLAYLQSGNQLYEFNLVTGALLNTPTLDTTIFDYGLGNGGLVGITYNSMTGNWEYRNINPLTGATTLVSTFSLPNGFTDGSFFTDPADGLAYLLTGNTLDEFNLATGAIVNAPTLDTTMQVIGLGAVPEPSTTCLVALGLAGLVLRGMRHGGKS